MPGFRKPIRLIPALFLGAIAVGAILLSLPIATSAGTSSPFLTALFTSTSAVAVTGLVVVDTPTYWSGFGQVTILVLFQVGGFGIMTAATLFGLMAGRGFGLRQRMATQVERSRFESGDAASVLKLVLAITIAVEGVVALILAAIVGQETQTRACHWPWPVWRSGRPDAGADGTRGPNSAWANAWRIC